MSNDSGAYAMQEAAQRIRNAVAEHADVASRLSMTAESFDVASRRMLEAAERFEAAVAKLIEASYRNVS